MRKARFFMLAVVYGMILSSCGYQANHSSPKIYNGSVDRQYNSVGLLVRGDKLWCSATRIGQQTALSAGHCFEGQNQEPSDLVLRFAADEVKVNRVTVHPWYRDWFGRVTHDVAILHLARKPLDTPITPIATEAPEVDDEVILVGYGYTDANLKESMDGTRRWGTNVVGDVDTYKLFFPEPENDKTSQTCRGDSGGPILSLYKGRTVQIGIVSGSTDGRARKTCRIETYAARVDAYVSWIEDASQGDVKL
jgi:secreted trypsin-like serine protease